MALNEMINIKYIVFTNIIIYSLPVYWRDSIVYVTFYKESFYNTFYVIFMTLFFSE